MTYKDAKRWSDLNSDFAGHIYGEERETMIDIFPAPTLKEEFGTFYTSYREGKSERVLYFPIEDSSFDVLVIFKTLQGEIRYEWFKERGYNPIKSKGGSVNPTMDQMIVLGKP